MTKDQQAALAGKPERISIESLDWYCEPVTESGCWLWRRAVTHDGYARVRWLGKMWSAHRLIYTMLRGPVPAGMSIDHLCRVRCCVNPDHLEVVTHRENTLRGNTVPAANLKKTHCRHGHPFDDGNISRETSRPNRRICKTCKNNRGRIYHKRKYRELHGERKP